MAGTCTDRKCTKGSVGIQNSLFEIFKKGKQDKVTILLFSVLRLGIVNQKY